MYPETRYQSQRQDQPTLLILKAALKDRLQKPLCQAVSDYY